MKPELKQYPPWLLVAGSAACLATWASLPHVREIRHGNQLIEIQFVRAWVHAVWGISALVCSAIALWLAFKPNQHSRLWLRIIAVALLLMGFPYAGLSKVMGSLFSWRASEPVSDHMGNSYAILDLAFMADQLVAITKIEPDSLFAKHYRVLCAYDNPRDYLRIVRPKPATNEERRLYLTENRMLIDARRDQCCHLMYDLGTQKCLASNDLEKLSPFLCLNSSDELNPNDVAAITKLLKAASAFRDGRPSKAGIEQGLTHPNPEVRKLAAEWLRLIES